MTRPLTKKERAEFVEAARYDSSPFGLAVSRYEATVAELEARIAEADKILADGERVIRRLAETRDPDSPHFVPSAKPRGRPRR